VEWGPVRRPKDLRAFRGSLFRQVVVLLLDGAIAAGALWLAFVLRFEGTIWPLYRQLLPQLVGLIVAARVLASLLFRLHRWSFRFSGLADAMRVALAGLLGTGVFILVLYLSRWQGPPRSVVVMELFFSTAAMGLLRFSPRLAWVYLTDRSRATRGGALRTLIVGAGVAGELLLRDLRQSNEHNYLVIGFVDDDSSKTGMIVGGKPVLGPIRELARIAEQHQIAKVLIAIPRLSAQRIREILGQCTDLKLRFKILPVSFAYLNDRAAAAMLHDLEPEDLLPREPVEFSDSGERLTVAGRCALVTGAAGSIGREICAQLLRGGIGQLVMVDLNENEMYLQSREYQRRFSGVPAIAEVADVRDSGRIESLFAIYHPQDVFHAAAHKHVPLMEVAPCEAVKNNILGTRNVASAADRFGAERFVFISTDKAVRPTSAMGASKRVAEMVVRELARASRTRFCAVRFGNVLGSAGSVVPVFRDQIAAGGPVTVTHPEVKRYFMTIAEAVGLVLRAGYGDFGELCVLDMGEQIRIADLARHMITMAGHVPDEDIAIEYTGLRPGEKLFEELMTEEEESTREVAHKIFVASSPSPPADLDERIEELAEAASREDALAVVRLLLKVVPSYSPPHDYVALFAARGTIRAEIGDGGSEGPLPY
jgi:FlaA1/EpsC-like NDP-sugar epimerase